MSMVRARESIRQPARREVPNCNDQTADLVFNTKLARMPPLLAGSGIGGDRLSL